MYEYLQIHPVPCRIGLIVVNLSSHRWYNKNITRGEAEDLLMKEVKTVSVFKDPLIIQFSLIYAPSCDLTKKCSI